MNAEVQPQSHAIEALLRAGLRLLEGSSASPRLDAEVLLAFALGRSRTWLFTHRTAVAPGAHAETYLALIRERQAGRPVAQLTGRREFWSLPLAVNREVLAPRPDTELLVEQALARIPAAAHWRVLDLGTGSGAVALAIAVGGRAARWWRRISVAQLWTSPGAMPAGSILKTSASARVIGSPRFPARCLT